jgi:hypothetical protein
MTVDAGPHPHFDHLLAMTDGIGTFEHAEYAVPRRAHGYCTDDMARVLVLVAREPRPSPDVHRLGHTAFRFLLEAQDPAGRARNRRDVDGGWRDRHGVDDCWGRSVAAFGTAANRAHDGWVRQVGMASFDRAIQQRSGHFHAMAFAALGAAEVLLADPRHEGARDVLDDMVDIVGRPTGDLAWPWPVARLSYANATVAEALVAAGHALGRPGVVEHGCALLRWLLERETSDGHLSLTPVDGSGPGDVAPQFDQQPIEAAAMADACARAEAVTGDPSWGRGVDLAIGWFLGENDAGAVMWDAETGGGYDGIHADGPNRNQGAESTIALLSTLQHARSRTLVTQ